MRKKLLIFFILTFLGTLTIFGVSYEKFFPLLKDVSGWKAQKPDGTEINMGGNFMMSASRQYSKGDKSVTVSMLVGSQVYPYKQMAELSKMSITTSDGEHVEVKSINSYRTLIEKNQDGSTVVVFFNSDNMKNAGALLFSGDNVSLNDLLSFSKNFDWKKFESLYKSLFK